jgi:hypothetical protein
MLVIREQYIQERDSGERLGAGDSGWYEPFTDNLSKLFRFLQKEYGACSSKVYVDTPDGTPDEIGWVFRKRMPFDDCPKQTFIREVWVTHKQVLEK